MALLTAEHPDSTLPNLCAAAQHSGCTVDQLIARYVQEGLIREGFLRPVTEPEAESEDVEELKKEFLEEAVERARKLKPGTLFSLNADHTGSERLFTREEWRDLVAFPWFTPSALGRSFKHALESAQLAKTEMKTGENKQIYARV